MKKLIKDALLKIAVRYAKNRFSGVEVHKNPFGFNIKSE